MNHTVISSSINNRNIIEIHIFLCHIMTIMAYFWLKFKIYPEKVLVKTNTVIDVIENRSYKHYTPCILIVFSEANHHPN